MPETKGHALDRAKREGFNKSSVVKSEKGGYFIAPNGIETTAGKKAYANCRADGGSKEDCAKIAWTVENNSKGGNGK